MKCEVNSILKLSKNNGYPQELRKGGSHRAIKEDYRILLVDVPVVLVNDDWEGTADVIIRELTWKSGQTHIQFEITRVYPTPFLLKED